MLPTAIKSPRVGGAANCFVLDPDEFLRVSKEEPQGRRTELHLAASEPDGELSPACNVAGCHHADCMWRAEKVPGDDRVVLGDEPPGGDDEPGLPSRSM